MRRALWQGMTVILHIKGSPPQSVEVADLRAASLAVDSFQSNNGMGGSDMGRYHGNVKEGNRVTHRVSYNGRVWKGDVVVLEYARPVA